MSKKTTDKKTEKQTETEARNPVELTEIDLENAQGGVITETFPSKPGTQLKLGGTIKG